MRTSKSSHAVPEAPRTTRYVRRRRPLSLAVVALLLHACGGGGDAPSAPSQPAPVLTTLTVTLANTTIEVGQITSATVLGRDQNGAAIATGTVTWSSSANTVATVNETGGITTLAPSQVTISATAAGRTSSASLTVTVGPTASVSASSATTVRAVARAAVSEAPRVLVRDARGFPVPNVNVAFTITSGGGTLCTSTPVSDASDVATIGGWTVGTTLGFNTVSGSVGTLPPVVFTAKAVAGAAA